MMIRLILLISLWMSNSVQAQHPMISKEQCLTLAKAMIAEGRTNIDRSTRPEDAVMLRTMTNDWQKRLDAGENPCTVYADIFAAISKI